MLWGRMATLMICCEVAAILQMLAAVRMAADCRQRVLRKKRARRASSRTQIMHCLKIINSVLNQATAASRLVALSISVWSSPSLLKALIVFHPLSLKTLAWNTLRFKSSTYYCNARLYDISDWDVILSIKESSFQWLNLMYQSCKEDVYTNG